MQRVLFIAYQFPPVGGAGVQRTVKFCKYLPEYGWVPSVLTVANPSVPVLDGSLSREIPSEVRVRRAATWEPGYAAKDALAGGGQGDGRGRGKLWRAIKGAGRRTASLLLQPDPQILWWPEALRQGARILRETAHQAIYVTAPPFSAFLVGAALSRRFRVPLVLDYRDEWTISSAYWENKRLGMLSSRLQEAMQRRVLRRASRVLTTTQSSARAISGLCAAAGIEVPVQCLYNGFDGEDFVPAFRRPAWPKARYRLAYIGTLWNLTSLAPLAGAIGQLAGEKPEVLGRLELVFAGRRTEGQQQHVEAIKATGCRVVEHAYLDHEEALSLMRSADGLLVLLSDLPGAERVVPAKIFECMAARRSIVAIAPRGEAWDLLEDYPAANRLPPGDVRGIADCLAAEVQGRAERWAEAQAFDVGRFERRRQAGELAGVLERVVEKGEHRTLSTEHRTSNEESAIR